MSPRRVLISGASIAGPHLAFWLNRYGFETTVVERAPQFRDGGQNIDVRGAGREVLRRGGLEDTVKAATTGELGTRFIRADGTTVAEFPAGTSDTAGATAEVEILRGDLARILVDATEERTEYVYGDHITALVEDADGVTVSFAEGAPRRFDLVVAADGIRSTTRSLVLGADEVTLRDLGLEMAYLTVPRRADDVDWWLWFSGVGGRGVTLRPDRHGTTRAVLSAVTPRRAEGSIGSAERRTPDEQLSHLRARFAGAGWQAERVVAALDDATDLYVESIGQVYADRWSSGRVALTGDAAWCASPVSGMGTTLSLVGSYVLAGELAAHVHHRDAFAAYERIMRPYVDQAQDLPPGTPRLANPTSRLGIAAFHVGLRLAARGAVTTLAGRLFSPPAEAIDLPDYAHLMPSGTTGPTAAR